MLMRATKRDVPIMVTINDLVDSHWPVRKAMEIIKADYEAGKPVTAVWGEYFRRCKQVK